MKHYRNFITLIVTLLALTLFTACESETSDDVPPPVVTVDTTPPVLTLNGEASITLEQNAPYKELGAMAKDDVDGSVSVNISGIVDTSTVGNYTVTYTARDSAGNEVIITRSVEVINSIPTLSSVTLEGNATTVNVGETVQLSVVGMYSDGSSNAVDENITYTISPNDSAEMNGSVLTAKKDGNVTVQATVDGVNSNSLNLNITWVVDGHTLPPEPDKAVNDATLLGVDSNNNGVRDDVERWIYDKYKDKHPIHIDIAMQAARAYKLVLETPEMAKEIHAEVSAPMSCEAYYSRFAKYYNEPLLVDEDIINEYFMYEILYNIKERREKFEEYDRLLSGGTYVLPTDEERKSLCDFNTNKYKE